MNRQRCLCWLWTGREESTPPGRPGANTGSAFPAPAPAPVCRVTSVPPASLSPGEKHAAWTPESVLDENRAGFGPHPDADGLLPSSTSAPPSVTRACVS